MRRELEWEEVRRRQGERKSSTVRLALLALIVVASVIVMFGALFVVRDPLTGSGLVVVIASVWRVFVKRVLSEDGEDPQRQNRRRHHR